MPKILRRMAVPIVRSKQPVKHVLAINLFAVAGTAGMGGRAARAVAGGEQAAVSVGEFV